MNRAFVVENIDSRITKKENPGSLVRYRLMELAVDWSLLVGSFLRLLDMGEITD